MAVRVPRIPRPGETVVGRDFQVSGGGKGANQAVAAARAGGRVRFVTALGADGFGDRARDAFVADGIDVGLVRRVPDTASGVATEATRRARPAWSCAGRACERSRSWRSTWTTSPRR